MQIIHFTSGATDLLEGFGARGARFLLPLADGYGDTHLSCLHLEEGARIAGPRLDQGRKFRDQS